MTTCSLVHRPIDVYSQVLLLVSIYVSVANNVYKYVPNNVSQDKRESVLCRNTKVLPGNSNLQRVFHNVIICHKDFALKEKEPKC